MKIIGTLIPAMLIALSGFGASESGPYVIDHSGTQPDPAVQRSVLLDDDEFFVINVTNTNTDCFTYNLGRTTTISEEKKKRLRRQPRDTSVATLTEVHIDGTPSYQVVIGLRRDHAPGCEKGRFTGTWTIPVVPRWNVALTGAFAEDGLTSHKWFLDAGKAKVKDVDTDGYFVRRQVGTSDQVNTSFAAMIHMFRRSPNGFLRHWAPISFGLGLKDENNASFMAGTSFRIGQKFFLTAGLASGKVDILPKGLHEGSFTTDANAIQTLGSRTRFAPFVAFSYSFLNVPVSFFQGKIPVGPKLAEGVPDTSDTEDQGDGDSGSEATLDPEEGKPGDPVTITGAGFGKDQDGGTVKFGETEAKVTSWSDTKIVVSVPAGFTGEEVAIERKGKRIATGTFTLRK